MLEMLVYFFLEITSICQLHHNAEGLWSVVEECLTVVDDVGVSDGGEDADLVESILSFFFPHLSYFDLSELRGTFFMA